MRPALANIITARVPEADLLIDTMEVRPQGNRAFLISDTIRRLKAADIWAKLDVLWMLAAHDAQAGRLNWKSPSTFALTEVNSPTFTADRGYAGNGSNSYLNTGWIPATNAVNYTQNSASVFAWDRTNATNSGALFGRAESSESNIFPDAGGSAFGRLNDQTAAGGFANTGTNGFWHADRQSSTARTFYKNGVSVGSIPSTTSIALVSTNYFICGASSASNSLQNASSHQIAFVGFGASLNNERNTLYSIHQSYMTAVGAA